MRKARNVAFRSAKGRPFAERKATMARGFTLAEVLLALGLTVVLMVAVYSAINNYQRMTTAGKEEVERARLAQSVFRKMERDIRSVVFRPPAPAAAPSGQAADSTNGTGSQSDQAADSTGGGLTQSSAPVDPITGESAGAMAVDTAAAYASSDVGLFGDISTLVIHVSRPSRDMSYEPMFNGDAAGSRTSDLQSVSWFLAVANGAGLQGAVGNLASGGSARSSRESGIQGLARLEGDRLAMNLADSSGDTTAMAEGAELVADEVNVLEFRYFDGVNWLEAWDSTVMGALPKAIEILIGFQDDSVERDARAALMERLGAAQTNQVYRLVVALPLSQ